MTSIAKTFATVLGAVLLLVGILGFINPLTPGGDLLGIFAIDPVHNVIHVLSGVVGLAAGLSSVKAARYYALVFGIVYALVTVVGFIQGSSVLGLITVNLADNLLHLAIAAVSLAVYFMTANEERTLTAARA